MKYDAMQDYETLHINIAIANKTKIIENGMSVDSSRPDSNSRGENAKCLQSDRTTGPSVSVIM